jgi:hypothetical protein
MVVAMAMPEMVGTVLDWRNSWTVIFGEVVGTIELRNSVETVEIWYIVCSHTAPVGPNGLFLTCEEKKEDYFLVY